MKFNLKLITATLLLVAFFSQVWPQNFISTECRLLVLADNFDTEPEQFDNGVLWKLTKPGLETSYLFGTIHVADRRVLVLPPQVKETLNMSRIYVMKALPDVSDMMSLKAMMF